jgi:hypothetical protein
MDDNTLEDAKSEHLSFKICDRKSLRRFRKEKGKQFDGTEWIVHAVVDMGKRLRYRRFDVTQRLEAKSATAIVRLG